MSEAGSSAGSSMRVAAVRAIAALAMLAAGVVLFFLAVPASFLLWVKALHVIAVISWMAGMLYLPRLFVYHVEAERGSVQSETFKVMERRLLRAIINPAMLVTWITGLWLASTIDAFSDGWFHVKFAAVLVLSGMHGYLAGAVRRFADDRNTRAARHWRIVNEIPTLAMVVIVAMVVVKPF